MPTEAEMQAELDRLKAENAALKARGSKGVSMKVSEKGGVSVYGLGRFPVTLYQEQWTKLLDLADDIRAFIKENEREAEEEGVRFAASPLPGPRSEAQGLPVDPDARDRGAGNAPSSSRGCDRSRTIDGSASGRPQRGPRRCSPVRVHGRPGTGGSS